MNRYQCMVYDSITDRLIRHASNEGISINDLLIKFDYYNEAISKSYYRPKEHMSKIMAMSYRKTMRDYR